MVCISLTFLNGFSLQKGLTTDAHNAGFCQSLHTNATNHVVSRAMGTAQSLRQVYTDERFNEVAFLGSQNSFVNNGT